MSPWRKRMRWALAVALLPILLTATVVVTVYVRHWIYARVHQSAYDKAIASHAEGDLATTRRHAATALHAAYAMIPSRRTWLHDVPSFDDPATATILAMPEDIRLWRTENLFASLQPTAPVDIAVSGIRGPAPYGYAMSKGFVQFVYGGYPVIFVIGFGLVVAYSFVKFRAVRWIFLALGLLALAALRPFFIFAAYGFGWLPPLLALALGGVYVWRARHAGMRWTAALHRVALVGLISLPFALALGTFLLYADTDPECRRVQADARVRFILSPCERDMEIWHKSIAPYPLMDAPVPHRGPRTIFASSDRESVYVGFGSLDHPWPSSVVKIERSSGNAKHVLWMHAPLRGICPRGSDRCFVSSYQSKKVVVLDDIADRIVSEIAFRHYQPALMAYDTTSGDLYFPVKHSPDHLQFNPAISSEALLPTQRFVRVLGTFRSETIVDPETNDDGEFPLLESDRMRLQGWRALDAPMAHPVLDVLDRFAADITAFPDDNLTFRYNSYSAEMTVFPFGKTFFGNIATAVYSPEFHKLYIGSGTPRPALMVGEGPTLKLLAKPLGVWRTIQSAGIGAAAAFDAAANEFYVSMLYGGHIYVFDAETFEFKRSIWVAIGVRDLQIDRKRRLMYVASYLTGYVYVLDLDRQEFIDSIFVGTKIREIEYVEEIDVILAATNSGFLEVTPPR